MYSKNLIKGTIQPLVLHLLQENHRMYGYEISQRIKDLTDNKIMLTEGALYPALHKLEADGILETEKEFIGKRVRKYYRLTTQGKKVVPAQIREFTDFLATMTRLINSKPSQ